MAAIDADCVDLLRDRVLDAAARRAPLAISGSRSKHFLGNATAGEPLDLRAHAGIVHYAPDELVITARAGTRIADLVALLAQHGQMLGFEPPRFGADATIGGTIAAGMSGPRRANVGAARDFVLGVRVLDGRGQVLRLGGEVIKNVAGYDVARLMTGAFGTLGVLLDISIRTVPRPRAESTRALELDAVSALERVRAWALRPLPISASAILDGKLVIRFSGAQSAVRAAEQTIGGDAIDGDAFWRALREHELAFFADARPLWRLSIAPASALTDIASDSIVEWHGALRWQKSDAGAAIVRAHARSAGGHATMFRADAARRPADGVFHPPPAPLFALHRRLKAELDPHGIFNPGRLYPGL